MSAGRGTLHLAARRKPHQRPRLSQRGAGETTNSAVPHDSLKFSLRLKPRLVLKAIIAGRAAHQLATPPIIENAAEILARDPSHSGKVALSNLLVNHNAAGSDIPTELFRELEQRPCDATFQ